MLYTTEYKTENGKTKKVPEKKEEKQKNGSSSGSYEDTTNKNTYGTGE